MVTLNQLKNYICLTVLSDISVSEDYKASTCEWYSARSHWPYLAYNAITSFGFNPKLLNEDEVGQLAEYCEVNSYKNPLSSVRAE